MKSQRYNDYLQSDHWKQLRLSVLKRANFKCERCASDKIITDAHHVHHINYRNLIDVGMTDLMAVCERCHKKIHKGIDKCYIPISGEATFELTLSGYKNYIAKNKKKKDRRINKYEITEKMCQRMIYISIPNQNIICKILKIKNMDFNSISGKKVKKSTYKRILFFLGNPSLKRIS